MNLSMQSYVRRGCCLEGDVLGGRFSLYAYVEFLLGMSVKWFPSNPDMDFVTFNHVSRL